MPADEAVNGMLEAVGGFLGVSRAYVMLDEKDGRYLRNTHEWVNHGTGPAMSSWPLHDYERDLPSLRPLLRSKDFWPRTPGLCRPIWNKPCANRVWIPCCWSPCCVTAAGSA